MYKSPTPNVGPCPLRPYVAHCLLPRLSAILNALPTRFLSENRNASSLEVYPVWDENSNTSHHGVDWTNARIVDIDPSGQSTSRRRTGCESTNAGRLLPLLASSHVSLELLFRMRDQIWEIYFRGTTKLKFLYVFGEARWGGGGGVVTPIYEQYRYVPPYGYHFRAFQVWNRVQNSPLLLLYRVAPSPPLCESTEQQSARKRAWSQVSALGAMGFGGKKCASWVWERKGQKERAVAKCITSAVWHLHSSSGDGR